MIEKKKVQDFEHLKWTQLAVLSVGVVVGYAAIVHAAARFIDTTIAAVVGPVLVMLFCIALIKLESPVATSDEDDQSTLAGVWKETSGHWYILTLTLGILGLEDVLSSVSGVAQYLILYSPDDPTRFGDMYTKYAHVIYVADIAIDGLAYFIAGVIWGKMASRIRYGHVAIAAFLIVLIQAFPSIVIGVSSELQDYRTVGLYAMLYLILALVGTRLGSGRPITEAIRLP